MAGMKKKLLLTIVLFFGISFTAIIRAHAQSLITGERISGNDRYQTSISISKSGWDNGADTIVLATGEDFPDALSAAPLAHKYGAPILLTNPNYLEDSLILEVKRLNAKRAYIVGGNGVISRNVENELGNMGIQCVRLSGNDRYETSIAVARELGATNTTVIATGENFPDALSIAPLAASMGIPILLTYQDKLPPGLLDYMDENNIMNTYIIGGEGVVSDSVASKLKGVQRINGKDRFATNLAVLNKFMGQFNFNKLYLATGNDFPDALSGSALASLAGSPVVLTDKGDLAEVKAFMTSNTDKLKQVFFLGGDGVVTYSAIAGAMPPIVTGVDITMPWPVVGVGKQIKASANAIMIPNIAAKPSVTYNINNPSIVQLDSNGMITGLTEGTASISASIGSISASQTIIVRNEKLIVLDPGHGGWSSGAVPKDSNGTALTQYKESVLNMQISQKLKAKLINAGYSVVMTREDDSYLSLDERAQVANNLYADIFISIHHDSLTKASSGTSSYYSDYKPGIDTQGIYVQAYSAGPVLDENNKMLGTLVKGQEYTYIKEVDGEIYIEFNNKTGKTSLDYVQVYDTTPSIVSAQSKELAELINKGIMDLGLPTHGVKDNNLAVTRLTNGVSVLVEVGFLSNPYEFEVIRQDSFQDKVADKIVQALQSYYNK